MARDPARIEPLIGELRKLWLAHPDWRLGQVIANAVRETTGADNCDPFYLEDDEMLRGIKLLSGS